jgi:hypothetical protein
MVLRMILDGEKLIKSWIKKDFSNDGDKFTVEGIGVLQTSSATSLASICLGVRLFEIGMMPVAVLFRAMSSNEHKEQCSKDYTNFDL